MSKRRNAMKVERIDETKFWVTSECDPDKKYHVRELQFDVKEFITGVECKVFKFVCNCPHFMFHDVDKCKHIDAVVDTLS